MDWGAPLAGAPGAPPAEVEAEPRLEWGASPAEAAGAPGVSSEAAPPLQWGAPKPDDLPAMPPAGAKEEQQLQWGTPSSVEPTEATAAGDAGPALEWGAAAPPSSPQAPPKTGAEPPLQWGTPGSPGEPAAPAKADSQSRMEWEARAPRGARDPRVPPEVAPAAVPPPPRSDRRPTKRSAASDPDGQYTLQGHLNGKPAAIVALFGQLDEYGRSLEAMRRVRRKHVEYFRDERCCFTLEVQRDQILLGLSLDAAAVQAWWWSPGMKRYTIDIRQRAEHEMEFAVREPEHLDSARQLIKLAYGGPPKV